MMSTRGQISFVTEWEQDGTRDREERWVCRHCDGYPGDGTAEDWASCATSRSSSRGTAGHEELSAQP